MKSQRHCDARLAMRGVAAIFLASLALAVFPARAAVRCVGTAQELQQAVADAKAAEAGSVWDIRVRQGTYTVPGGLDFATVASFPADKQFTLLGGYTAGCSSSQRARDPDLTVVKAGGGRSPSGARTGNTTSNRSGSKVSPFLTSVTMMGLRAEMPTPSSSSTIISIRVGAFLSLHARPTMSPSGATSLPASPRSKHHRSTSGLTTTRPRPTSASTRWSISIARTAVPRAA